MARGWGRPATYIHRVRVRVRVRVRARARARARVNVRAKVRASVRAKVRSTPHHRDDRRVRARLVLQ